MAQPEKQTSSESSKPKIRQFRFKPEGYVHLDDSEFLEQFTSFLANERQDGRLDYSPSGLVYSGADTSKIFNQDGSIKKPMAIFAMNEISWKRAANSPGETTPAGYADGDGEPCILLYDRQQLAHAYDYRLHLDPEDTSRITEISNLRPGKPLAGEQVDDPVEEVVIHKDFPNKSLTDALVGIVFIEDQH